MPKGKWFLTYVYDWVNINSLSHGGKGTETESVPLGKNITDENQAIEKAGAEWAKIISQYPNGKKAGIIAEKTNPRDPKIIYVVNAVFSAPPKVPDQLAKLKLL
jgi:hypothetical protein